RHTRSKRDWSSDVCSSDLLKLKNMLISLANQFPQNAPTFYNSESMQNLKSQIDNVSNYIIKHNSNISLYKQDFDEMVKEKDELRSEERRVGKESRAGGRNK